jgi:hypothetical protein
VKSGQLTDKALDLLTKCRHLTALEVILPTYSDEAEVRLVEALPKTALSIWDFKPEPASE